jgi:tRNA pseudouridine-54 N-methylase
VPLLRAPEQRTFQRDDGPLQGANQDRVQRHPIEEIHPSAMHAAVDANCLADLNSKAYWAYVDFLHAHGPDITGARFEPAKSFLALDHIANTCGAENKVDEAKLGICLKRQDETQ